MSTADTLNITSDSGPAPELSGIAATMARALVAAGIHTQAEVDGMAAADGFAGAQPASGRAESDADPLTQSMAAGFDAPATPGHYTFNTNHAGGEFDAKTEAKLRGLFYEVGVDQGLASLVAMRWTSSDMQIKTPEQIEAMRPATVAALTRAWGSEWEANLALAQGHVASMAAKRPEVKAILDRTGLGSDPFVIQAFYQRAVAQKGA